MPGGWKVIYLQPNADQPVPGKVRGSGGEGGPANAVQRSVPGPSGERGTMLSVVLLYLSGGTRKPRFLQAPAEYRENTPFTSNRWFRTFWEANESSGRSSQKCTDTCTYYLAHSFRRLIYS